MKAASKAHPKRRVSRDVDYERLCDYYDRLEATTKRLEMTDILVELLREAGADVRLVVYLTRGQLAADFEGIELGVADKLVIRTLVELSGRPDDEVVSVYHRKGDLGDAAVEVLSGKRKRRQATLFGEEDAPKGPLTVREVHDRFFEIARATGSGSQERKLGLTQTLLSRASPRAAGYIVRTITGKLRLGIADMTILDALAAAYVTKEYRPDLERAYNVSSDLGLVAETLLRQGLAGVEDLRLRVGVPVRAMLAERLPTPEDILEKLGGTGFCELKYDGLRLQAHIPASGPVRFYSRRLEDVTSQFPDVAEVLRASFLGREAIVEGEAVPVDPMTGEMRPFQDIAARRGRKHGLEEALKTTPVTVFLFDCLLLDGEDVTQKPLPDRRAALERSFGVSDRVQFSRAETVATSEALLRFFDQAVAEGAEGIMVKSVQPDSAYRAGARGWQWIKYKRDYSSELNDTLDLVVVGALVGRGRRAGWYGALMMAAYNRESDVFETVCKLGTGFDDATLEAFTRDLQETVHEGGPHPRVRSKMAADVWFHPSRVLEVVGAELTVSPIHTAAEGVFRPDAGLAVRFPRYTGRLREDKKPEEATNVSELIEMYRQQGKKRTSDSDAE
ncbi:MAG TPA: ATP-dependent DNA ligase [Candidatus Thermoplasmatota archaeon]|nr:ATP-dependent DNA ligase [Candidatus Thermoplasmatota archaeon]